MKTISSISFPDRLSMPELQKRVADADRAFEDSVLRLTNRLSSEEELLLIGLTGPTCSGKTTAANMLDDRLTQNGRNVYVISIDDFFYEKKRLLALSRESGKAGLDYDSEKTIDVQLLEACVSSLLAGKPTNLPHFNFYSGLRERGVRLIPQKGDIFLLEGIQILYPNVSSILRSAAYHSIAICPQSAIRVAGHTFLPNEIRLMRRLVRDVIYRGSDASFTFSLWKNVRENEEKNIFPYLKECDYTVDSTMPYEIGVLKPYLSAFLSKMQEDDPAYETAKEILQAVEPVQPVDSALISPNSLYREFI